MSFHFVVLLHVMQSRAMPACYIVYLSRGAMHPPTRWHSGVLDCLTSHSTLQRWRMRACIIALLQVDSTRYCKCAA